MPTPPRGHAPASRASSQRPVMSMPRCAPPSRRRCRCRSCHRRTPRRATRARARSARRSRSRRWPRGARRDGRRTAPGGIALKPCGEGCQKSTSSGGSARCRKCENQPKSVLAMKPSLGAEDFMWTSSAAASHVSYSISDTARVHLLHATFEGELVELLASMRRHKAELPRRRANHCAFHASRTLFPPQAEHRFHGKPNTRSEATRLLLSC